jgi:hypothetical protein
MLHAAWGIGVAAMRLAISISETTIGPVNLGQFSIQKHKNPMLIGASSHPITACDDHLWYQAGAPGPGGAINKMNALSVCESVCL